MPTTSLLKVAECHVIVVKTSRKKFMMLTKRLQKLHPSSDVHAPPFLCLKLPFFALLSLSPTPPPCSNQLFELRPGVFCRPEVPSSATPGDS